MKGPAAEFKCGHTVSLKQFAHQDCPSCTKKRRIANAGKKVEKQRQKRLDRPAPTNKGRLPDGTQFVMVYNGKTETWSGQMMVPQQDGEHVHGSVPVVFFRGKGSGLFRLEEELDKQFRESLKPPCQENGGGNIPTPEEETKDETASGNAN